MATSTIMPPTCEPPSLASAPEVTSGMDRGKVYGIYQTFRTAVATRNASLRQALSKLVAPHRKEAAELAEQELAAAPDETSRAIARETLEALRTLRN